MSAVASVLISLNKFDDGIKMQEKAVRLASQTLEASHPTLLSLRGNLANNLSSMGRFAEAATIQQQLLDTTLSLYPSPQTQSLAPALSLSGTLEKLSRFKEASRVLEEAVKLSEEAKVSTTHPDLLKIQNMLTLIYLRLGGDRLALAETKLRELLAKNTELYGEYDKQVLMVMNNLGGALQRQDKFSEAVEVQKNTLEKCKERLGDRDRFTMRVGNNLGESLRMWGESAKNCEACGNSAAKLLKEAEQTHFEVLSLRTEVLGRENCDTLTSMVNLGCVLQFLGKEAEAWKYSGILEKLEGIFGCDNEVVKRGKQRLANLETNAS
jgi:tetratricopeptide (TPR) repeat protein